MNHKRSRGFTLIEIIVAMMIIAITAISALEFYKVCLTRFIGESRHSLEATDFGRDTMEDLYFVHPANLADTTQTEDLPTDPLRKVPNELKDNYDGQRNYTVTSEEYTFFKGTEDENTRGYRVIKTKVDWLPK